LLEKITAEGGLRWDNPVSLLRPNTEQLNVIAAALDGKDMHVFNELVAKSMYYHLYNRTDVGAQRDHIDAIFNTNSLELRRIRGVVEYK